MANGAEARFLATKFAKLADELDPSDRHALQALLLMAMDPLDRQVHRVSSVLSDNETKQVLARISNR